MSTNAGQSIKEVLTFPFMKDVVEEKPKTAAEVVGITPKPEEGIRMYPPSFERLPNVVSDTSST